MKNKIIHIIVDDLPTIEVAEDPWIRENIHRDKIENGLKQLDLDDNDIICLCDVDEIPDKNILKNLKHYFLIIIHIL